MATNHYFNHYGTNTPDQRLVESIVIESIKSFGIDVHYMPRTQVNTDSIFGEDRISKFEDARMVEVYVKSIDGFEGDGTFVSNFGLEVRDQITFTISRRRFIDLNFETGNRDKEPLEGDLIFFPLSDSLFEIKHVQDTNVFYQMGGLQTFDLVCELFEYADEAIDTGIAALDQIEIDHSYSIKFTLGAGTGTYTVGESVYQGSTGYSNATIKGEIFGVTGTDLVYKNLLTEGGDNLVREDGNSYVSEGAVTDTSEYTTLTIGNIIGAFSDSSKIFEFPYSFKQEDGDTTSDSILLEDESLTTPNSSATGKLMIETTASYVVSSFDDKTISTGASTGVQADPYANNVAIETVADSILDFSEGNPFSEGTGY